MKTALLLSGGVDSSLALRLLKEEGHNLTAFYLKIWLQDDVSFLGNCPWEDDLKYARAVCEQNDVELKVVPLQDEYWDSVVAYTIDEIKAGRTPNPDMFCNSLVKFGTFFDKIDETFSKVATGHYARIKEQEGKYLLKRTPDPVKDQTYFLALLNQQQLSRALFPLGKFTKKEVRALAEKYNLPSKNKKDSQGICFLGQIKFKDFIEAHLGKLPGDIVDISTNKKMGTHDGYYYYTIGQRSGLGLSHGPWYVVKKDVNNNIIYISQQRVIEDLSRKEFTVTKMNWASGIVPQKENLQVKIRHGAHMFNCTFVFIDEHNAKVVLDEPEKGIAPGQFAVFYDDDLCLGGAVISG